MKLAIVGSLVAAVLLAGCGREAPEDGLRDSVATVYYITESGDLAEVTENSDKWLCAYIHGSGTRCYLRKPRMPP